MDKLKNAPFNQAEVTEIKSSLHKIGNKIVHTTAEFGYRDPDDMSMKYDNSTRTHLEGLKRARELFAELTDVYGVSHAGFAPVVGTHDDGNTVGFVASSFVEGESCVDPGVGKIPDHQKPAAKKLLDKLTVYATDKHQKDEEALTDIFKLEQYKYVPDKDEMILVDTDPLYNGEWGGIIANRDLPPIARQVLDREELNDWYQRITSIDNSRELVQFGHEF